MALKYLVSMSLYCTQEDSGWLTAARFFMEFSFEPSRSVMAGLSLYYFVVTYIIYSSPWSRDIMFFFS